MPIATPFPASPPILARTPGRLRAAAAESLARHKMAMVLAIILFCQVFALHGIALAAETSTLTVAGAGGRQVFQVEVADTPAAQARGLMYRRNLAPDAGMLFPFGEARQAQFWMRNTYVPLDLLFIAADGRIESIHADAAPLDDSTLASQGPVIAVLEILAGEAARRGIRPGDQVLHPALPAPQEAAGGRAAR